MIIEKAAFKNLEIEKIISLISRHCRSELGSIKAADTAPASDLDKLTKRQELFVSVESYREKKGELPWTSGITSVSCCLDEGAETGVLTGQELFKIKNTLILSQRIKNKLTAGKAEYPAFSMLTNELGDFAAEIEAASVISDDGRLYDNASDKLRNIRETMRGLRDRIRRKSHALLNDPQISGMLQERVLSLRNMRHAFLVRQDALSSFPGIVVDRSGSGNSVYMEPHSLLLLNNQYASAKNEEQREELRILRKITAVFVSRRRAILDTEGVIGTLDLFFALSEMKRLSHWSLPSLSKQAVFNLKRAKHPLLGERAVPIDIKCGYDFRSLVITGPNTGGKTVALKTAGVCLTLSWLGFLIPAGEGSVIGDIDNIFADIGDEQSVEQSLSTFSAHVTHMKEILENVTARSLVLLDELGAGTDPEEGAALGIAVLDWLREKRTLVLATTHHNPVKRFAMQTPSIETASVEFDVETLSPTYRVLIGIPGRSNALLIAGKLGMPEEVIARALKAISSKEISMEDLISELHEKRASLERENIKLEDARKKMESLREELTAKTLAIEEKKDTMITVAEKKALSIIHNAEKSAKALIKNLESAETESHARRELEKKRSHFAKIKESAARREEKKLAKESAAAAETLKTGDTVQIIGTSGSASVIELRGKKALVQARMAEIEVPLTRLRLIKQTTESSPPRQLQINISHPVGVPSSIMVRGMTIDEAVPMVEQYLDQAYRAGYDTVTVIHGRGEGILRREVHELCKRITYITEHKLGGPGEGGYGVTIVKFRK